MKRQRAANREKFIAVLAEPGVLDRLCKEIADGATIFDVCRKWDIPYSRLHAWVHDESHIDRLKQYSLALEARQTYFSESVLAQLVRIGWADIRKLYGADGKLLDPGKIPDDVAQAISSLDVEYGLGNKQTKKVKMLGKLEALTLLGKNVRMFVERSELSGPNGGPLRVEPVVIYLPENGRGVKS